MPYPAIIHTYTTITTIILFSILLISMANGVHSSASAGNASVVEVNYRLPKSSSSSSAEGDTPKREATNDVAALATTTTERMMPLPLDYEKRSGGAAGYGTVASPLLRSGEEVEEASPEVLPTDGIESEGKGKLLIAMWTF